MTTVALSPVFNGQQFFDNTGKPLAGGKIFTYQAGSTSVLRSTFTTSVGNVQNTNPIILNSSGRAVNEIWLDVLATYNLVLTDSSGTTVIEAINDVAAIKPGGLNLPASIRENLFIATAGQTVFGLSTSFAVGTNMVSVFRNGARLYNTRDYVETSATVITLNVPTEAGDEILISEGTLITTTGVNSSEVGYAPAGTSAVATNVQTKLREYVSVKDFGAVGDGVANDTAAVQSAMNYGAIIKSNPNDKFLCQSPITITNKSIDIQGGEFIFTSNSGFNYTSNDITTKFSMSDVTVLASGLLTGAAITAAWSISGATYQSCEFTNVRVSSINPSSTWASGIHITNGHNNLLTNIQINNRAPITYMTTGILVDGAGVSTTIVDSYLENVDNGIVFRNGTYNSKVQNTQVHYSNTCINFDYSIAQYGAILSVEDCILYPIAFGIKATNVIALSVLNNFFQKDLAGTWVGVQLDQGAGIEIFESIISNNQFGNNLGTAPWTGINVVAGRTITITENIFDSSSGTCINMPTGVTENIVKNNTNAQANTFIGNVSPTNKISDNFNIPTYQSSNATGTDAQTTTTPNVKNYLGNATGGYIEISNSGGAASITGLYNGVYWQVVELMFSVNNVTLVHNTLAAGSRFILQGSTNHTPKANDVMSFIAIPDGSGNINWVEVGSRSRYNGLSASIANTASANIFVTPTVNSFYTVCVNGAGNTTVYATAIVYFNGSGGGTVTSLAAVGMSISAGTANTITITNSGGAAQAFEWSITKNK